MKRRETLGALLQRATDSQLLLLLAVAEEVLEEEKESPTRAELPAYVSDTPVQVLRLRIQNTQFRKAIPVDHRLQAQAIRRTPRGRRCEDKNLPHCRPYSSVYLLSHFDAICNSDTASNATNNIQAPAMHADDTTSTTSGGRPTTMCASVREASSLPRLQCAPACVKARRDTQLQRLREANCSSPFVPEVPLLEASITLSSARGGGTFSWMRKAAAFPVAWPPSIGGN
ncbi:uncharacterized protein LOC144098322 [Amblyomma americanum]